MAGTANIHPTALVAPGATLGSGVEIGPYCVVGADVTLGDGVTLVSHVCISGVTSIGARTRIQPFCSLGSPPQSTRYKGEATRLVIGTDCDLREQVTMNTGTVEGGGETRVGDRGLFMVGAHIAHDCIVGNDVTFANNATLGGHSVVGDRVVFGGLSACHQFSRIGEGAMIGGMVGLREDVIPFGLVDRSGALGGLNLIGLKRRGASKSDLHTIRRTVRGIFFGDGTFEERKARAIAKQPDDPFSALIIAFLAAGSKRPILKFGRGGSFGPAETE